MSEDGCKCPGLCDVHRMWKGGESLRIRTLFPDSFVRVGADLDGRPVVAGLDEAKPEVWNHDDADPIGEIAARTDGPSLFLQNGYSFNISRQMAEDHGLVERSDDDARKAYESHVAFIAEAREAWIVWQGIIMTLGKTEDPLARKVLNLHAFTERQQCAGCDYSGWEADAPEWPCPTVRLVVEHVHPDWEWPAVGYGTAMQCGTPEKITLTLEPVEGT